MMTFNAHCYLAELIAPNKTDKESPEDIDINQISIVCHEQADLRCYLCAYDYKSPNKLLKKFSSMLSNSFNIDYQGNLMQYIRNLTIDYSCDDLFIYLSSWMSKRKCAQLSEFDSQEVDELTTSTHTYTSTLPHDFSTHIHTSRPSVMVVVSHATVDTSYVGHMIDSVCRHAGCQFVPVRCRVSGYDRYYSRLDVESDRLDDDALVDQIYFDVSDLN